MTRIAYDVAANDRMDLEGKVVNYTYSNGNIKKVLVVGVNRAVGITVVKNSDKDYKMICIRGPVVSDPSEYTEDHYCTYNEHYDAMVQMIENGELFPATLIEMYFGHVTDGRCNGNCAYGQ